MKRQKGVMEKDCVNKRQKVNVDNGPSIHDKRTEDYHETNDVEESREVSEIISTDEICIETDGEINSSKKCCIPEPLVRKSETTRTKLEDGFGFKEDTMCFRLHKPKQYKGANGKRSQTQYAKKAENRNKTLQNTGEIGKTDGKSVQKSINVSYEHKSAKGNTTVNKDLESASISTKTRTYSDNNKSAIISGPKVEPGTPEIDVIYTRQLCEWKLPQIPNQVPSDFADMSSKKLPTEPKTTCLIPSFRQKPDQQTNLLIKHEHADKPEGDEFGAKLYTYIVTLKSGRLYYRHFFKKVQPKSPAEEMKIEDQDELVILNNVFVPNLPGTDVLNHFLQIKVDGRTRLSLVVRRKRNIKKWDWIESSAILAPDKAIDNPAVKDLEYEVIDGNKEIYEPVSKHMYKVPGTQKYIDICGGNVRINTMKSNTDRTKIIRKRTRYWQADEEGHIDFASTLNDVTTEWYIAIDQQEQILVKHEPVWFKMIMIGDKIRFQFHEVYIGYNIESGELKAQVNQCEFVELPATAIEDITDNSASATGKSIPENVQTETLNTFDRRSERGNLVPRWIGASSASSSTEYLQSVRNSDRDENDLSCSCGSVAESKGFSSLSSSQSSDTSGYTSVTQEIMDVSESHEMSTRVAEKGFLWSKKITEVKTPSTPMKALTLFDSEID